MFRTPGTTHFERFSNIATVLLFWVLAFGSYRPSGRLVPYDLDSLDWIAVVKVLSRLLSSIVLLALVARVWSSPRSPAIKYRLLPLALFAGWAVLSTLWSPLQALTLGKAFGLVIHVLLAAVVAARCRTDEMAEKVVSQLALMLLILTAANFLTMALVPLGDSYARAGFLMGRNDIGQIAGLGIILLTFVNLAGRQVWSRLLVVPGALMSLAVLYAANSRTASFATAIILFVAAFVLLKPRQLLAWSFLPILAAIVVLFFDPIFNGLSRMSEGLETYLLRGQALEEFTYFTGRPDKWKIAITGILASPIIGHGYSLLSPTGYAELYGKYQIVNAHNMYLFVLAGTGVVGAILFTWGLWRALAHLARIRLRDRHSTIGRLRTDLVLLVLLWFLIVGVFELSFLSSVNAQSVVAFAVLGIGVGAFGDHSNRSQQTSPGE